MLESSFTFCKSKPTIGPFIRDKISRDLHKTRLILAEFSTALVLFTCSIAMLFWLLLF